MNARRSPVAGRRSTAVSVLLTVLVAVLGGCVDYDFGYPAGDDPWGADMAVDLGDGTWWIAGRPDPVAVGAAPAYPVPGNYDGDAFWEPAVVRPVTTPTGLGAEWITNGAAGTLTYPAPPPLLTGTLHFLEIVPVPADYDGDGTTDPAWYRFSDASWWIEDQAPVAFGVAATGPASDDPYFDQPVPADYDGDGDDDIAVFRITDRTWHSLEDGPLPSGGPGYLPVPGRYDLGVPVQPATASFTAWAPKPDTVFHLPTGTVELALPATAVGGEGLPVPADYDNDGRFDPAIADRHGTWVVRQPDGTDRVEAVPGGPALSAPKDPVFLSVALLTNVVRLTFAARCLDQPGLC